MNLISCHIDNFGRLRNYDYTFTDGLNMILRENGWGKSTFAAFLCAMFYGLPAARKKRVSENEREKYRPWQGGVYGGRLVFEAGGSVYEAGRTFGSRESEDTFELRDVETNLPSFTFSAKLGEELFRMGRESFLRTVFTAQQDCRTAATDDVNALVANLAEQAGDMSDYERAMKRLWNAENRLSPKRQTGLLYRHAQEILRLERETAGGQDLPERIRRCAKELQEEVKRENSLQKQLRSLEADLSAAEKAAEEKRRKSAEDAAAEAAEQIRQRLTGTREKRRRQAAEAGAVFPGQVPARNEIEEYLSRCRSLERLEDSMQDAMLSEAEQQRLTELEELAEIEELEELEELEKLEAPEETEELEQSKEWKGLEQPKELEGLKKLGELEKKKNQQNQESFRKQEKYQRTKGTGRRTALSAKEDFYIKRGIAAACMAVGIILLLAGIAVFAERGETAGAAAAVLGAITVAAGFTAFLRGKSSESSFKERYLSDKEGYLPDSVKPSSPSEEYAYLLGKEQRLEELHARWSETRRPILAWLHELGFSPQEDFRSQLEELRDAADSYEDARALLQEAEEELYSFETELRARGILLRENADEQAPGPLRENTDEQAPGPLRENADEQAPGPLRKNADEPAPGRDSHTNEDPAVLRRRIEETHDSLLRCREGISERKRELEDLQAELEEWENAEERLRTLRAAREEEYQRYMHVTAASALLKKAKETMTARCADPIRDRFCDYWEMITRCSAAGVYVDANSNVTVQEMGRQRDTSLLSTGYGDLAGICLRIALADAMYPASGSERPPLILDDPFTNLDDEKTGGALQFLQEISARYQILYFTCSSARCR